MTSEDVDKLLSNMESMQKEMHKMVDFMRSVNSKISHQDCVNIYILHKLAELKIIITKTAP